MRTRLAFILVSMLLLTITAAGCYSSEDSKDPDITGLIFSIEGNRVLIVSDIEDAAIDYDDWFMAGHRAIFFTVTDKSVIETGSEKGSFDDLVVGLRVEAWADGPLAESYPEQGTAKKIIILK